MNITTEWIEAHRRKLIAQGAVCMLDGRVAEDMAVVKAIHGLPWGIPGLGLYRRHDFKYEMRVESTAQFEAFTADVWRDYLSRQEPSARYVQHHIETGTYPFNWRHVVVWFEIVKGGEIDE